MQTNSKEKSDKDMATGKTMATDNLATDTAGTGMADRGDQPPMSYIAAVFDDEEMAKEAYNGLKDLQKQGTVKIENAAVLVKTDQGKIRVAEKGDMRGGKGAIRGGLAGGVVGLIAGSIFWPAAVGAMIGGIAAKARDKGFNNQELGQLAEEMNNGTSVLVAIVTEEWIRTVADTLKNAGYDKIDIGAIPDQFIMIDSQMSAAA
jgi:uncharacterized membrane protein